MIISKLIGGLGNQLFQYAAGKSLSLKHGVDFKVDVTALNEDTKGNYTQRYYELSIFETNIKVATQHDVEVFKKSVDIKLIRYLQRKFPSLFTSLIANESGSQFHVEFFNYPRNTYLNGFWQSEKYFLQYEQDIRNDFVFNKNIIDNNKATKELISNTQSVSLHVRRGDYVTNKNAQNFHGLCSLAYYEKAVKYLNSQIQNIELFVFSDDIEWCKQNFKFNNPIHFIETNNAASDLYLMTQCKHNIIANSSFSWWGAWLNNHHNKVVVAPFPWFADKSINSKDILPEKWVKIQI